MSGRNLALVFHSMTIESIDFLEEISTNVSKEAREATEIVEESACWSSASLGGVLMS